MPDMLDAKSAVSQNLAPRGLRLREMRDFGKIDLRGDPSDREFMSAVGRVLDLVLPTEPCASTRNGDVSALWLGPDQWLIISAREADTGLVTKLDEALASVRASITDVSAGRVVFRLAGPNAIDVLAKGCPLDLHPSVVKPGYVAGSVLAKITALVHLVEEGVIDLHVGRSFADYAWTWLEEAGLEYGVTVG
ncbi:MAG: sarcosine oxidase subunit gamma [Geminicoccaceae bacterium]